LQTGPAPWRRGPAAPDPAGHPPRWGAPRAHQRWAGPRHGYGPHPHARPRRLAERGRRRRGPPLRGPATIPFLEHKLEKTSRGPGQTRAPGAGDAHETWGRRSIA